MTIVKFARLMYPDDSSRRIMSRFEFGRSSLNRLRLYRLLHYPHTNSRSFRSASRQTKGFDLFQRLPDAFFGFRE